MHINFGKANTHFSKAFASAEKIDYDRSAVMALKDILLERDEVVAYRDFKDRRVLLYWTEFGTMGIVEENNVYLAAYDKHSPLKDLVPWVTLDDQGVLFVCGCNTENDVQPNICGRVNNLIDSIKNFYED